MKASLLYKVSSCLLFFFGLTHTFGMFRQSSKGLGVDIVISGMRTVRFDVMGASRSLWDFYFGFGLLVTVFLLFSAVFSWQLGSMVKETPQTVRKLAWPFAVAQAAVAVLCWTNFFAAPAIVSTLTAVCLVLAALRSTLTYSAP